MIGRGQDLQVISPPQDFLTLTQTHRPARLRVGDSVRFLQDNRAAEVTVLSGHPRLRGETDPACLLRSLGVNSFVPNRETKEFGRCREKIINIPSVPKKGVAVWRQSWRPLQRMSEDSESKATARSFRSRLICCFGASFLFSCAESGRRQYIGWKHLIVFLNVESMFLTGLKKDVASQMCHDMTWTFLRSTASWQAGKYSSHLDNYIFSDIYMKCFYTSGTWKTFLIYGVVDAALKSLRLQSRERQFDW